MVNWTTFSIFAGIIFMFLMGIIITIKYFKDKKEEKNKNNFYGYNQQSQQANQQNYPNYNPNVIMQPQKGNYPNYNPKHPFIDETYQNQLLYNYNLKGQTNGINEFEKEIRIQMEKQAILNRQIMENLNELTL